MTRAQRRAYDAAYYAQNRERIRAAHAVYQAAHRETRRAEVVFAALFKQPCVYHGGKASSGGIACKVPLKGFSKKNVVPCCKTCRRMKGAMTHEEFKVWVRRICVHVK